MEYVLGHVIGDFLCQTGTMADNKYKPGAYGLMWCAVHVFVYTYVVLVCVGSYDICFGVLVYLPHWLIDRYSLAYRWMGIIGRAQLLNSKEPIKAAFGAIIYVVIDQALHAGCLYLLYLNY